MAVTLRALLMTAKSAASWVASTRSTARVTGWPLISASFAVQSSA
jgi:hypothetical protein